MGDVALYLGEKRRGVEIRRRVERRNRYPVFGQLQPEGGVDDHIVYGALQEVIIP
jgi:hypothetical protein